MKNTMLTIGILFFSLISYSQTYLSSYMLNEKKDIETQYKDRIITINDKEISIPKFNDGYAKTLYLVVNKTEEKEYSFEGKCKYYYCTTRDKDIINGYQKAIIIKSNDKIFMALFATEIDVYWYQFAIN